MTFVTKKNNFHFFLALALALTVNFNVQASVFSDYNKIKETIGWIYSKTEKRRPTGTVISFTGAKQSFSAKKKSANGADTSFAFFLYRTYDLYCNKKSAGKNCLGKKLKVKLSIKGKTKAQASMSVQVDNKKISSSSFQEVMKEFYLILEKMGGSSKLTVAEKSLVLPEKSLRARVQMQVIYPKSGTHVNEKWIKGSYVTNVFSSLQKAMYGLVGFTVKDRSIYKDTTLYNHVKMFASLKKFNKYKKKGNISAIITGPFTKDAAGLAYRTESKKPNFAMKSRSNVGSEQYEEPALRNTAMIFLHELGHNMMGLNHCKRGQAAICTDNITHIKSRSETVVKKMNDIGLLEASYIF